MSPHSVPRNDIFEKINEMTTPQYNNNDERVFECVVVVDPFSTGFNCAQEIKKRGYEIIAVWTDGLDETMKSCTSSDKGNFSFLGEVEQQDSLAETKRCLEQVATGRDIIACLVGAESGVDYIQQELIKGAGLRSCREAVGSKFTDVESFLKTESYPVVLKPTESAGSDGVKLCETFEEAKDHFNTLMSRQTVYGGNCPAVLCQEFLRGQEFVVDQVSRDGVHKTCMIWVYDKRPANGSAFVVSKYNTESICLKMK